MSQYVIHQGDCMDMMALHIPDQSVQTCITSPPYFGLRDYGVAGQLGLENTPDEYVAKMVEVFREVYRVLRDDGTLWLNLGDSYAGSGKGGGGSYGSERKQWEDSNASNGALPVYRGQSVFPGRERSESDSTATLKPKNLCGIPWRVAFALQADGWYLRQDIIWNKPNPMPESVRDRCTKAHEYIFLLSKREKYHFDAEAIGEPLAESSVKRLSQPNLPSQQGSDRVPGKTNGNMKAVGPRFGGNKYGDDAREESRTKSGNEWKGSETGKRNRRSVWTVTTKPFKGAHFATFPMDLIEPCVLAGSKHGDLVLDPFGGAGTVALAAMKHGRDAVLCELNPEYIEIARTRINAATNQLRMSL